MNQHEVSMEMTSDIKGKMIDILSIVFIHHSQVNPGTDSLLVQVKWLEMK